MRWPIRIPIQHAQHDPRGPVEGDRVIHRLDAIDVEPALLVGVKFPATVGPLNGVVLHVVFAVAVGLPDVEERLADGAAAEILDGAADEHALPGPGRGDAVPMLEFVRVVVERPQHRGLGGPGRLLRVDGVDERRDAQDVGEENHLLPVCGTGLANLEGC